ncbi:MAG TPA: hypothetical protein VNI20_11905 [Fimbriimonadaceae bacterium]|nr:hypothetical protein [Fimbriimonadaceae bacterium]
MSGQGRRSPGDLQITIGAINVRNDDFDVALTTKQIQLTANSYQLYSVSDQFQVPTGAAFKHYSLFPLTIYAVSGTDTNGNPVNWGGPPMGILPAFPADVTIARGRDSVLQFSMNDAIVPGTLDSQTGLPDFDRTQFETENLDPISGNIESVFSDYVAFDMTAMSGLDRPNMANSGPDADMVLYSGDAIALSAGTGSFGSFQILDPKILADENKDQGVIQPPITIGGVTTDGTYTLFEPDPSQIDPLSHLIVSLQGRWRPYTQVLSNIGDYAMIIFPNSRNDTTVFTAVYIKRDPAGNVVALWQGPARFSGANANEIRLTRIKDIVSGLEINPAVGSLSDFIFANGEVTSGTFTFPSGTVPGDFPFPLTGQFRVFRK